MRGVRSPRGCRWLCGVGEGRLISRGLGGCGNLDLKNSVCTILFHRRQSTALLDGLDGTVNDKTVQTYVYEGVSLIPAAYVYKYHNVNILTNLIFVV